MTPGAREDTLQPDPEGRLGTIGDEPTAAIGSEVRLECRSTATPAAGSMLTAKAVARGRQTIQ